jgi:hypothetical protein
MMVQDDFAQLTYQRKITSPAVEDGSLFPNIP